MDDEQKKTVYEAVDKFCDECITEDLSLIHISEPTRH